MASTRRRLQRHVRHLDPAQFAGRALPLPAQLQLPAAVRRDDVTGHRGSVPARALRALVFTMFDSNVPGRARAVYNAVLRHAALAPLLALWRDGGDEETRVAAADVVAHLLMTNADDAGAALHLLLAAGIGGLLRAGIANERAPMALVDATGRLAIGVARPMMLGESSYAIRNYMVQVSSALRACMVPWPELRVEKDFVGTMTDLDRTEFTVCGRHFLIATWTVSHTLSAKLVDGWCAAIVLLHGRVSNNPLPHPLAALNPFGPAVCTLSEEARTISAAVDPAAIRAHAICYLLYAFANGGLDASQRARVVQDSGLYSGLLRTVELAVAHVGVVPIHQLDVDVIIFSCALLSTQLSVRPPKRAVDTEQLATHLLKLSEWQQTPAHSMAVRAGYRAQSSSALAAARLVGSRESSDRVTLSAVRCPVLRARCLVARGLVHTW